MLQVRFLCLSAICVALSVAAPDRATADDGFVSLFDGATLDGWEGKPEFWRVENGAIVGETTAEKPTQGNTFLIWRQGLVDDFELAFTYRLTGGNSGVQYRSKELRNIGDFVVGGYQADFEAGPKYSGILYEEKGRGILAERGQRITITPEGQKVAGETIGTAEDLQQVIKPGDWNDVRIVAEGNHIRHYLNGMQILDFTDDDTHALRQGVLALQLHAGAPMWAEYRNIRMRPLPAAK